MVSLRRRMLGSLLQGLRVSQSQRIGGITLQHLVELMERFLTRLVFADKPLVARNDFLHPRLDRWHHRRLSRLSVALRQR